MSTLLFTAGLCLTTSVSTVWAVNLFPALNSTGLAQQLGLTTACVEAL